MNHDTGSFPVVPLRLTLRSEGLSFPGFAGSLWHGGLGMMLARHFPAAFAILYAGSDETRPYALRPPLGEHYPPGSLLELRLGLFGPATAHVLACTQAIMRLGETGLDPAGHYRLERASVLLPAGEAAFFSAADGLFAPPALTDFRNWLAPGTPAQEVGVRLLTPLRIKEGGELLRHAPTYEQLLHRLLGRLDQLAHRMGSEAPLAKHARAPLFAEARQVTLLRAELRWQRLERRSARSRQQMSCGGLLGDLHFAGDLTQTLPWLIAGQPLQIGGKTAFGFGGYAVAGAC